MMRWVCECGEWGIVTGDEDWPPKQLWDLFSLWFEARILEWHWCEKGG